VTSDCPLATGLITTLLYLRRWQPANWLIAVGGILLFAGLFFALSVNRAAGLAFSSTQIGKDIAGRTIDAGWWWRRIHLAEADQRFRWGLWLTAAGIFLQTVGGVLSK
jgi:hypothetical protein